MPTNAEGAVNVENVSRDDWIIGGLALLLVITLLFFPWYHIGFSLGVVSASLNRAAASSPYAIWGILAVITSLLLLADLAFERLAPQTNVPAISNSRTTTRMVLAAVTALLLVIKFFAHVGSFGWGFFVALITLGALCFLTWQAHRQSPVASTAAAGPPPPPAAL
jgi:hypothetical protein